MRLKCHNCGTAVEYEVPPKEFVCAVCGAVNVVPVYTGASDEELGCISPTGFEWQMPAGRIGNPVLGYKYVTAQGTQMTREEYLAAFKIDPEVALSYMRKNKGVRFGSQVQQ
ncbi:MAG: zinc ribbon domain-containing protein [Methanothrix sp.]|jgi:transcription elongation factor Elf1|nr:zinc ribbon domain-containing protein [Methanothrix sp.]